MIDNRFVVWGGGGAGKTSTQSQSNSRRRGGMGKGGGHFNRFIGTNKIIKLRTD